MKISILWVGKTKNTPLNSRIVDYLERIRHLVSCEIVEVRDISRRRRLHGAGQVAAEAGEVAKHLPSYGRLIALDEKGIQLTSSDFARWLESEQNRGERLITFVIGGHEGLSQAISGRAHLIMALGKMTWTHEMCRVLLLEQVYRALCILRKIPYHR